MSEITKIAANGDNSYKDWLKAVSLRYRQSQIKAANSVNAEMLLFYWTLGREIKEQKDKAQYGDNFIKNLSRDLQRELPDVKSFSPRNLRYMVKFYELYSRCENACKSLSLEPSQKLQQVVAIFEGDGYDTDKVPLPVFFQIPWGHHVLIIDKCKNDLSKALFFVNETIKNGWSRAVLLNFLDTDLYDRQGKAVSNFNSTLPAVQSDLAQAITKDPYCFDFLTLTPRYNEKELKDALLDNIERFLLELGNGFAFIGREYRIEIGGTENFIDMLFYHLQLHCFIVVEVKVTEFEASYTGQLGTYVVAINHQLKTEKDAPTLGLLICKEKDNIKAQYALEASGQPLGISEYKLSKLLPTEFRGTLPSIEELERELERNEKELKY